MRELSTHARFGLLMSALALMSAPSAVSAQETCATDADCAHGFSCETVGGGCPAIDCADGSDCDIPECEPALGCMPVSDCDADADCPASWVCESAERSDCGDIAEPTCASDEDCVKPDPADVPECNTVTVTYCVPPWQLPCEEAADCGPGFECVERIAMSCSGSGGSSGGGSDPGEPTPEPADGSGDFAPPAEGDPLPPDDPGSCTSEPTGEFYCQLIETTCETDADCAAGLTCQQSSSDAGCSAGTDSDAPAEGGAGGSDGSAGAGGDDGAAERPAPPTCETPEPTFACAPPSYNGGAGWGYDLDGRGEATGGSDTPNQDDEGGDGDGNGGLPPASPTGDKDGLESEEGAAGSGMSESSSGCSATGSSRASGSALLMMLAVLGLGVRRRVLRA
jgi:MYXO-CTERM domain-containing protein